ncbi:division/cell wall cluster transcriptional repressor MraZ [Alkalispirochaeta americana]|uniref:division/cell wall cluster transcriptional repressor MraZ n=1 Tax=Alkalispirochaeta americana TaxID=159291 RepID=UPI0009706371|nr:division/cell wall cluster transcriptional repressor MraZ [Alkalispirochaeta americana]
MITGQYRSVLDEKGRVLLPSRLRGEIPGSSLVVTAGIDRCLWLFPPDEWKQLSDQLMEAASPFSRRARLLQRRIIAPAQEIELDKTGRILIPPSLKETVGLKKDCVLHGIKKYIEIWDVDEYSAYLRENEDEFQEAAEELGGAVSFF